MTAVDVQRLDVGRREDFLRLHCDANGLGWCRCVAWWVESWDGWGERSAEQNLALRERLFARDERDGYLAYRDGEPVGWLQAGPRDHWPKLRAEHDLARDPDTWALPCLAVAPAARRGGVARALVAAALEDLARRGVGRVEAYPRSEPVAADGELWNGPVGLWEAFGFQLVAPGPRRAVWARAL